MTHATAFEDTYRRFLPSVRARCRRMLRQADLAEDVAQETFVRLWQSGLTVERTPRGSLLRWLHQTSTRLSIDVARSRRREPLPFGDLKVGTDPGAADRAEARELLARIAARAPSAEIDAAILVRVDGLSQPAAAEALSVSERTVRRLLDRFDQRLRGLGGEHERRTRQRDVSRLMIGLVLVLLALVSTRSCAASSVSDAIGVSR